MQLVFDCTKDIHFLGQDELSRGQETDKIVIVKGIMNREEERLKKTRFAKMSNEVLRIKKNF